MSLLWSIVILVALNAPTIAAMLVVRVGLGYALFLGSLTWIATFPVSVSV